MTVETGTRSQEALTRELNTAIDVSRLPLNLLIAPHAAEYILGRPNFSQTLNGLSEGQTAAFMEAATYMALVLITGKKSDEGVFLEASTGQYLSRVDMKINGLLRGNYREREALLPIVNKAGSLLSQGYYLGHFTPESSQ